MEKEKLQEMVQKEIARGRWSKALEGFKLLVEMEPHDLKKRLKLAELYLKVGNKEEALKEYKGVASSYARDGYLLQAISVNKIIVRLDPSLEDAHQELARLYAEKGLRGEAEAYIQKEGRRPKPVPLFSELTPDEFSALVDKLITHKVPKDSVVVKQGDPGDSMFVIIQGAVKVVRKDKDGQEISLAELKEGDFFGEIALVSGQPRIASVITTEETELMELTRSDVAKVVSKYPRVKEIIQNFCKERIKDTREKIHR